MLFGSEREHPDSPGAFTTDIGLLRFFYTEFLPYFEEENERNTEYAVTHHLPSTVALCQGVSDFQKIVHDTSEIGNKNIHIFAFFFKLHHFLTSFLHKMPQHVLTNFSGGDRVFVIFIKVKLVKWFIGFLKKLP